LFIKENLGFLHCKRKQNLQSIFTSKSAGQGYRLGLPIGKGIVKHHGGRIWVESEIGKDSTFSFALPITEAPKPNNKIAKQ
jgi:signal transduction histidine kinase